MGRKINLPESITAVEVVASVGSMTYLSIAVALAVCFVFVKNEVIKNAGFSLSAICGAYGIISFRNLMVEVEGVDSSVSVASIGLTVMFVGACIFAILKIISFFGFVQSPCSNTYDEVFSQLAKCRELVKEGIVTDEEVSSIKNGLFKNIDTFKINITDLKKFKNFLTRKL